MELTWYGHSNFKLASAGKTVLIDPFFEGNPTAPITAAQVGRVDAVCVTHDHADHVGQAVDICKAQGAKLVGVFDTVNQLMSKGLPQKLGLGMNVGGTIDIDGLKVKMVQAMHSTASGVATGYILTFPDGFCAYHAGDTGLFSSMELFGKFHDIDLALLPIGGWFTMDPKQAAYACKLLGCRMVAAMHWGTFPILEQNTDSFRDFLENLAPDTRLVTLEPGRSVKLK
ncbi:MAG: metal-dependent hydrolase [Desulfovibrionaceae bacterium]|nr:metal-dependent hydrolase [Desulfovibrionaceae bacterium]